MGRENAALNTKVVFITTAAIMFHLGGKGFLNLSAALVKIRKANVLSIKTGTWEVFILQSLDKIICNTPLNPLAF